MGYQINVDILRAIAVINSNGTCNRRDSSCLIDLIEVLIAWERKQLHK